MYAKGGHTEKVHPIIKITRGKGSKKYFMDVR